VVSTCFPEKRKKVMARLRLVTIYSIGGFDDNDVAPSRHSRHFPFPLR
jgi:hypothetical protein